MRYKGYCNVCVVNNIQAIVRIRMLKRIAYSGKNISLLLGILQRIAYHRLHKRILPDPGTNKPMPC